MTLRDLTPRQIYNLQRKARKEMKEFQKSLHAENFSEHEIKIWEKAYNKGFIAGLSTPGPRPL